MTEPTKGLRLAFTPGMLGLHFRIGNEPGSYPNDMEKGERDMAYINSLIEADERRRESEQWPPSSVISSEFLAAQQKCNAALRAALDCQAMQSRTDGIALISTAHPRAPWWRRLWRWFRPLRLSEDSLETIEIDIPERKP